MRIAFIITLIFPVLQLFAQPAQIIFDHYDTKKGFNSREAKDITSTGDGLVWISSDDGLARYDSKQFKFYRHDPADSNSLTYNFCEALEKDKRGWIWLQSYRELEVFNPETEKFYHIKITGNDNKPGSVWPKSFYYDYSNDIMWIGTRQGLYYSKQGSMKLERAPARESNKNLLGDIFSLCGDADNIWATSGKVIYKINPQNFSTKEFVVPEKVNGINNQTGAGMICSYLDKKKILWMGTWVRGLVCFNTITGQFQQYVYSDYTRQQNAIISIAQTGLPGQEDILWVSTVGFGFAAFNTNTKTFSSYSTDFPADLPGIKGNTFGLYTVPGQGMWIGSQTGLHYYDFSKQIFGNFDISSISRGGEKNLSVSEIAFEKGPDGEDERLWFHVPYRGTYIYDLRTNSISAVPRSSPAFFALGGEMRSFFIDSKNVLWVSNSSKGLIAVNLKTSTTVIDEFPVFAKDWSWVNSFLETGETIWLGTFKGLFGANRKNFNITEIKKVNEELNKNKLAETIQGMIADDKGWIWFVTDFSNQANSSIGCYDPAVDAVQFVYKETAHSGTGRPLNEFYDITFSKGKVFVSDYMNGIWYFNTDEDKPVLKLLNHEQGLNNTRVGELIADKQGNIWCRNNLGISLYKIKENLFINYPFYAYGLELEVGGGAMVFSPQSGKIYIGHPSFIYFIKTDTVIASPAPAVLFTGVSLFGKPLPDAVKSGNVIRLSYKQNTITADFVLPSYSNSFNNLYSWKLEGLEPNWKVSADNTVTYTNLSPGRYTLRIRAANSMGVWSEEKFLVFIIKPPFYKRWWFIAACALFIIGFAWYLFQLRIARIKERYQLRNKIAADLHDEIGSTLTSISILSNVSQKAFEKEPGKVKEMLQQIATQSKTVQQNMSDIVWAIRPDNEKLEDLMVRMREYAAQTLEPQNIKTSIAIEPSLLNKVLPVDYRKEVLLVYKEAINNIAKHAGATEVHITMVQNGQHINMTIKDNGRWKGNGVSSGNGLLSMQQRAKTIGGELKLSHDGGGTLVQLGIALP